MDRYPHGAPGYRGLPSPDPRPRTTAATSDQLLAGVQWGRRRPCIAVRVELPAGRPPRPTDVSVGIRAHCGSEPLAWRRAWEQAIAKAETMRGNAATLGRS